MTRNTDADDANAGGWGFLLNRARRIHDVVQQSGVLDAHTGPGRRVDVERIRAAAATLDELTVDSEAEAPAALSAATLQSPESLDALTPSQIVRQILVGGGYSARIGKLLIQDGATRMEPRRVVPHNRGLPRYAACVAPDTVTQAGAWGVFVTLDRVVLGHAQAPWDHNDWQVAAEAGFDNANALLALVRDYALRG